MVVISGGRGSGCDSSRDGGFEVNVVGGTSGREGDGLVEGGASRWWVKVMVWLNELVDLKSYVKSEKRVMFFFHEKKIRWLQEFQCAFSVNLN